MFIIFTLFWAVVLIIGFNVGVRTSTARLNNRSRPDGSYADYDFPGILNGGDPVEFAEPDLKGPGPHEKGGAAAYDLYGRPLPPEVAEKRWREAQNKSGISANPDILIRLYQPEDWRQVQAIIEPVIRAGETYALDPNMTSQEMHQAWIEQPAAIYVAVLEDEIVGTYYLKRNQAGGGIHVANCGYVTASNAQGKGIAATMCLHSQVEAKRLGFRAMQFNFVVSTNQTAIRLWKKLGFDVVGTLPKAFKHPSQGYVDALVMYKLLQS